MPDQPARDVDGLINQLREALSGERADWEPLVETLIAETWSDLHAGGPDGLGARIGAANDALAPLAARIARALPPPGPPAAEAALALRGWERVLRLGEEVSQRRAADTEALRPGTLEHTILKVLWTQRETPLRRGQIHEAIPKEQRRTPARVSQVLDRLREAGLVIRSFEVAPGARQVAHYQLYGAGIDLAKRSFEDAPKAGRAQLVFGDTYQMYHDAVPNIDLQACWGAAS